MPESSSIPTPPTALPVLSRGRHRTPARGACFMEFTALLAGEPFSDRPACVDPALAAILRGANDTLSDEERAALVPLLGRAIGLVAGRPDGAQQRTGRTWLRPWARTDGERSAARTARLHARVSERFRAAVGVPSAGGGRHPRNAGVGQTFWDLMSQPAPARTSREYSARLVHRLEVLHGCYEDALADLGLPVRGREPGSAEEVARPAAVASPVR